jgi:glycine betaine/proline transport system permease protein
MSLNLLEALHLQDIFLVGTVFEKIIDWLTANLSGLFDLIAAIVDGILAGLDSFFNFIPPLILIIAFAALAWKVANRNTGIFTLIGFFIIYSMGLWSSTTETLSLIITSVVLALAIAIPVGIWASKNDTVEGIVRPILDFMQTLPAFVYLIPAVLFFRLGPIPGVVATLIFSLPPAVRLTNLGIRQVPREIKEASLSFGSTPRQLLVKAELPVALTTIMAGVNQTIMLALSMVVIAGMIGAGGLGNQVLKGITQLKIGLGFESGISIVILAIFLDRVTQALGQATQKQE